jgi:hypothetical protein
MIQREDKVERSVERFLKEQMAAQGYPDKQVSFMESFDVTEFEDGVPSTNYIATGFNFDDGGAEAEAGSTLTIKTVTIEFFIIAKDATWGRNLKNAIVTSFEEDKRVPLWDFGEVEDPPLIDYLPVLTVTGQREPIPDPAPWQRFVWTALLRLEDEYYAGV